MSVALPHFSSTCGSLCAFVFLFVLARVMPDVALGAIIAKTIVLFAHHLAAV
jgi:hypothetical protein